MPHCFVLSFYTPDILSYRDDKLPLAAAIKVSEILDTRCFVAMKMGILEVVLGFPHSSQANPHSSMSNPQD